MPRDLRPAAELADRGYRDLGPQRASLSLAGGEVALYSTSEARRRRDGMWARTPAGVKAHPRAATVKRTAPTWLRDLLQGDFVVLDTETTGLGASDEIIEVAVVDGGGTTLLHTLVWPHAGRVPQAATRVHGLRIGDLAGAPTWPQVLAELGPRLRGRRVLAWNAPFDERMARQSSGLWGVPHDLPDFECAMRAYALARGLPGGRSRLAAAAATEGVMTGAQRHRSVDDARLALAVLTGLAGDRT